VRATYIEEWLYKHDDDDDDLQWVPALTVPMHLGLIDRPFVPHNLISAQENPVPLPKFQMAPRHKILILIVVPSIFVYSGAR
jgi:hypothetical protein